MYYCGCFLSAPEDIELICPRTGGDVLTQAFLSCKRFHHLLWLFAVSDPKLGPFSFKVVGWITRLMSSTENFCSWPKIGAEGDKLAEQLPQSVWGWAVSDFR